MVQCIEQVRKDRLANKRMKILQKRWASLRSTLIKLSKCAEARAYDISVGDIAFMPEVRAIVDAADDVAIDAAGLEKEFSGMIEQWKDTAAIQLRELVTKSRPVPDPPQPEAKRMTRKGKARAQAERKFDVLELATTRFHCNRCNKTSKALYYPGLLAHPCLRDSSCSAKEDVYTQFVFGKFANMEHRPTVLRRFDVLSVAQPSAAADAVIRLCGKNPDVVTAQEMDALDVMILRGDAMIRTWRSAVRLTFMSRYAALLNLPQILFDDSQGQVSGWSLASPDDVAAADEALPELEEQLSRYRCVRCDSLNKWSGPWRPAGAIKHLRSK